MRSLQSRLGTGLLLSLIIAFSVLWTLVSINIQYLAEEYISTRLEHDAENLLNAISFNNNGDFVLDDTRIDPVYNQPFSGHYYIVSTNSQSFSSRSLWDQTLDYKTVGTGIQQRTSQHGPEGQLLLVLASGYSKQGIPFTISIAESLDPIKHNINQFRYWFAAMAAGILILLVIIQITILRRSLRPLAKIQDELKSLEQGELEKLSTDSPDELRPLINEVNHLLSVVEQRLRRSRDASSDLAHAIKKPLTVIQQMADNSEMPEAIRTILQKQSNDIHQLTDRILKRARLAGSRHGGTLFSFYGDLPDLTKTLGLMYAGKSLHLSTKIPDNISCNIDREDMLELLGNLLDNAYKWANRNIQLDVMTDSSLHIQIEDDGPGADPDKYNELSNRGVRLDENVQGHGLGLAIAADIVNDYGGTIQFTHAHKSGGFRVEVSLPLNQ